MYGLLNFALVKSDFKVPSCCKNSATKSTKTLKGDFFNGAEVILGWVDGLPGLWQRGSLGQQILATAGLTNVAANLSSMSALPPPVVGGLPGGQFDQASLLRLMHHHQQQEQNAQHGGGNQGLGAASLLRSHSAPTAVLATSSGTVGGAEGDVGSSRGVSPDIGQGQVKDETGSVLSKKGPLSINPPQAPQWRQPYPGVVHGLPPAGASPSLASSQAFASSPSGPQSSSAAPPAPPPSGAAPGRSKQRARRGQATDPHSIAERLRRERIAERMKSLQELVPNSTRVDKASMLDEIIEYVRFLQLQVKVLSISRLNGAAAEAVKQLMEELEKENFVDGEQLVGGMTDAEMKHTERQVALLLETDMGSAMQYLQSKGLCLMPIAMAATSENVGSQHHVTDVKMEPGSDAAGMEEEVHGGASDLQGDLHDTMDDIALEDEEADLTGRGEGSHPSSLGGRRS